VHKLGLRTEGDWREWKKSGEKPFDISAHPERTYKDKGWAGMGDWLGNKKG
jgi:hypothetical protein